MWRLSRQRCDVRCTGVSGAESSALLTLNPRAAGTRGPPRGLVLHKVSKSIRPHHPGRAPRQRLRGGNAFDGGGGARAGVG